MSNKENKNKIIVILFLILIIISILLFYLYKYYFDSNIKYSSSLSEANQAVEAGDDEKAERIYASILAEDNNNINAQYGMVNVALMQGDREKAKSIMDKLAELDEDKDRYTKSLFIYALNTEDYGLAQSLVDKNPELLDAEDDFTSLISGLISNNYLDQAQVSLSNAMAKYPNSQKLRSLALELALLNGDDVKFMEIYKSGVDNLTVKQLNKVIELSKDNLDTDNLIEQLEKSLRMDDTQVDVLKNLYTLYARKDDLIKFWNTRVKLLAAEEELPKLEYNIQGNSFDNSRNMGLAAQQGDIIYFQSSYNHFIYKAPVDNLSDATKLTSTVSKGINVKGDWVYFINLDDNETIYRVKTDASTIEKIWSGEAVRDLVVYGDKIYFINKNNNSFNQINLDGSGHKVINVKPVFQYVLDPENIYYLENESRFLHKQSLNRNGETGEDKVLKEGRFAELVIDEYSNLFYLDLDKGGNIYRTDNEGHSASLISSDLASYLFYHKGYLYYTNWFASRIDINGNHRQQLGAALLKELAVLDSWIFGNPNEPVEYIDLVTFKHDGTEWADLPIRY